MLRTLLAACFRTYVGNGGLLHDLNVHSRDYIFLEIRAVTLSFIDVDDICLEVVEKNRIIAIKH